MADEANNKEEGETHSALALLQQKYGEFISALPLCESWVTPLRNYRGFWQPEVHLPGTLAFLNEFRPRDTDILLTSAPKSGTNWCKALIFATVNRKGHSPFSPDHPLLHRTPLECIPFANRFYTTGHASVLDTLPPPRLLSTHLPYSILSDSVTSSDCKIKIVYVSRNPKDNLVSAWHFRKDMIKPDTAKPFPFEEAYEMYCGGVSPYGPVWDHNLEYWRESLKRPEKVLFLKYEDLKEEPAGNLKKLADFIGYPFSEEEEKVGVVEGIVKLCSFENISSLEVNQTGYVLPVKSSVFNLKNSSFFRKGKVGDWKNHMTLEMAMRLQEITQEKLQGSGLSFYDDVGVN